MEIQASGIADYWVNRVLRQPDGRLIVFASSSIVRRLLPDGALDASFTAQLNPASSIRAIALQADGNVLVASEDALLRLDSTGSDDPAFVPFQARQWVTNETGQSTVAYRFNDVLPLAGGGVLVASSLVVGDGAPTGGWFRLRADGTVDPDFHPPRNNADAIVLDSQGRIIVAEAAPLVDGQGGTQIGRYLADGSPDPSFRPVRIEGWMVVFRLAILPDGRIAVAGTFRRVEGLARNGLALVGADGGLDPGFDARDEVTTARDALPQNDGRLLVAGELKNPSGWPYLYYGRFLTETGGPGRFEWAVSGGTAREDVGDVTISVARRGGSVGEASVRVATQDWWGPTTPGKDYVPLSEVLTFARGETLKTVHLALVDDALLEPTERLVLVLSDPTGGAELGSQKQFELDIVDDDAAVEFGRPLHTTVESEASAVVRVVRTGFLGREVSVGYQTRDETAIAGSDYQAVTGVLTFPPGATNATFTVLILADSLAEPTELVGLVLTNPGPHLVLGSSAQAELRILDDGPGAVDPRFRVEGLSQVARMVLDLEGRWVVADEPTFSSQYLPLYRLDSAGQRDPGFGPELLPAYVRTLAIQADGCLLVARDPATSSAQESESCSLFRLKPDGTRDTTFAGCEAAPRYTIALALQADGRILVGGWNGNPGTGPLTPALLRLEANGTVDSSFQAVCDGFVDALVLQPDGRLIVSASQAIGQTESRLRLIRLNPDGSVDPTFVPPAEVLTDWQWALALAVQTDGRILVSGMVGPWPQREARLVRLEPDGRLDTSFRAARPAVDFALALQAGGKILVGSTNHVYRLASDGSLDATFGESGNPEGLVTEDSGWIECLGLQAEGGVLVGGRFSTFSGMERPTVVRLQNGSASAAGALTWTTRELAVAETAGQAELWVARVGGHHGDVMVNYATHGGTAQAGRRYQPQAGVLRFADGDSAPKRVTIPILDDRIGLGDQTFFARLANSLGGAVLAAPAEVGVTIAEDDTSLRFEQAAYQVCEHAGFLEVRVIRRGLLNRTSTVMCNAVPGTAQPGRDYTAQPTQLTFAPGETTAAFRLSLIDNAWGQWDRSLTVVLRDNVGADIEEPAVAVTILDDDRPGQTDPGFDPVGVGWPVDLPPQITALLPQSDGSVIAAGWWLGTGTGSGGLLHFGPDGALDPHFGLARTNDPPVTLSTVQCVQPVTGGRYLLGLAGEGLARCDEAGAKALPFAPALRGNVTALLKLSDERLLVGGDLWLTNRDGNFAVVRLRPDGVPDETFAAVTLGRDGSAWWDPWPRLRSLALASDGGLLLGGWFNRVNGTRRTGVAKLLPDGTVDPRFQVEVADSIGVDPAQDGEVVRLCVQPDGRILIAGRFLQVQGMARSDVARLEADGTLDVSFIARTGLAPAPRMFAGAQSLALQSDGKIVIAGLVRLGGDPPSGVAGVVRLAPDGSLDSFFTPAELTSPDALPAIPALAIAAGGAIWVGGSFTYANGELRPGLARLHGGELLCLRQLQLGTNGSVALEVLAPQAADYGLEASSDLAAWFLLGVRSLPAGANWWTVAVPFDGPQRFFRLSVQGHSPAGPP